MIVEVLMGTRIRNGWNRDSLPSANIPRPVLGRTSG
jgi:hypothetical protein